MVGGDEVRVLRMKKEGRSRLYTEHALVDYRADSCSFTHLTSRGGGKVHFT